MGTESITVSSAVGPGVLRSIAMSRRHWEGKQRQNQADRNESFGTHEPDHGGGQDGA